MFSSPAGIRICRKGSTDYLPWCSWSSSLTRSPIRCFCSALGNSDEKRRFPMRNSYLDILKKFFYDRLMRQRSRLGIMQGQMTGRLSTAIHCYPLCPKLWTYPLCPRCNRPLEREYQAFCDHCDQVFDWRVYPFAALVFHSPQTTEPDNLGFRLTLTGFFPSCGNGRIPFRSKRLTTGIEWWCDTGVLVHCSTFLKYRCIV